METESALSQTESDMGSRPPSLRPTIVRAQSNRVRVQSNMERMASGLRTTESELTKFAP